IVFIFWGRVGRCESMRDGRRFRFEVEPRKPSLRAFVVPAPPHRTRRDGAPTRLVRPARSKAWATRPTCSETRLMKLRYVHRNPVKRGLVAAPGSGAGAVIFSIFWERRGRGELRRAGGTFGCGIAPRNRYLRAFVGAHSAGGAGEIESRGPPP